MQVFRELRKSASSNIAARSETFQSLEKTRISAHCSTEVVDAMTPVPITYFKLDVSPMRMHLLKIVKSVRKEMGANANYPTDIQLHKISGSASLMSLVGKESAKTLEILGALAPFDKTKLLTPIEEKVEGIKTLPVMGMPTVDKEIIQQLQEQTDAIRALFEIIVANSEKESKADTITKKYALLKEASKNKDNILTLCHNLNLMVLCDFAKHLSNNDINVDNFKVELYCRPMVEEKDMFGNDVNVTHAHEFIKITDINTNESLIVDPWVNSVADASEISVSMVQCNRQFFIYDCQAGKMLNQGGYFSRSLEPVALSAFETEEVRLSDYIVETKTQKKETAPRFFSREHAACHTSKANNGSGLTMSAP